MKKHVMVKFLLMLPVLIVLGAGSVAMASSSSEDNADAQLELIKMASVKEFSTAKISASPKLPDLDDKYDDCCDCCEDEFNSQE